MNALLVSGQFTTAIVLASSSLTLDDVRITTTMLMPMLDAVKSVFMMIWPYLLAVFALRAGAWLVPVIFRKIGQKKS